MPHGCVQSQGQVKNWVYQCHRSATSDSTLSSYLSFVYGLHSAMYRVEIWGVALIQHFTLLDLKELKLYIFYKFT